MTTLAKPKFGAPCNGCGHCCKTVACSISRNLLKSAVVPCIALESDGMRYWCGMVKHPERYMDMPNGIATSIIRAYATMELHIGDGCDDNSSPGASIQR